MPDQNLTNLEQLLKRIERAASDRGRVSWGEVLEEVGHRSFGPLLLLAGLITLAPLIGDIPGVPTTLGIFVFLIAVQLLLGQKHFWLPHFLLDRSVERDKLCKAVRWLRSPARFIDRFLRSRMALLTGGVMEYVIAAVCLGIAVVMPVMEVIPFSANLAGIALSLYGLSLIARDGLLALLAFGFTGGIVWLIVYKLF